MHPEVGNKVQKDDIPCTNLRRGVVQNRTHDKQTQISQGNAEILRLGEKVAEGIEVAGRATDRTILGQTLGTGGDIQEEVQLPSEELVADELQEGDDGGFLGEMLELLDADVLLLGQFIVGPGDEDGVLLHVAGVAVVAGMGDLPGEVGDHQEGVGSPADNVVEGLMLGEGTMAAFMSQNPYSGADTTLEEAVDSPGEGAQRQRGEEVDVEGAVGEDGAVEDVAGEVEEGGDNRGVEAFLGNGVLEGLQAGDIIVIVNGLLLLLLSKSKGSC